MNKSMSNKEMQKKTNPSLVKTPDYQTEISQPTGEKMLIASLEKSAQGALAPWVLLVTRPFIGDDGELGSLLMKDFFHALLSEELPPLAVIFVNKGVQLACLGSPVLDCLSMLQSRGSQVLSCRTSLEHYNLRIALCAGTVASMYGIIEKLRIAAKVITP